MGRDAMPWLDDGAAMVVVVKRNVRTTSGQTRDVGRTKVGRWIYVLNPHNCPDTLHPKETLGGRSTVIFL